MPISKIKGSAIEDDAITSARLDDGTIVAVDLASDAVTTAKIADGAVTGVKIGNGEVDTTQLANSSVTTDKITDGNITVGKLASTLDLSSNTVTLPDGNITTAKLDSTLDLSGKTVTYGLSSGDLPSGTVLQHFMNSSTSQVAVTTNQATAWVDAPTSSITITPTSSSSDIIIQYFWTAGNVTNGLGIDFRVMNGGSSIKHYTNVVHNGYGFNLSSPATQQGHVMFKYSHGTTSAMTFKIQCAHRGTNSGTFTFNDSNAGTGGASPGGCHFIVTEIA